jgi:hypothetical protein
VITATDVSANEPDMERAVSPAGSQGHGSMSQSQSYWVNRSITIDWPRKFGFLRTLRSMFCAASV